MELTTLIFVMTAFAGIGLTKGDEKTRKDICLQHRDCVFYQFCYGNEFACCAPAYDDPTNTLYCWCCKQDCDRVQGNYCRNASGYGIFRDQLKAPNGTAIFNNFRRRGAPLTSSSQNQKEYTYQNSEIQTTENDSKLVNGNRVFMTV